MPPRREGTERHGEARERMREARVGDRVIRLMAGDITSLDIEAFVYDARADLVLGAGYGTAIATRGGPSIQQELRQIGSVPVGEAVVSAAGKMRAKFIIHAVAPKFGEADEEPKLRAATQNALTRAAERGITRLALPALSAGFYGMPAERSARIMLAAVRDHLEGQTTLQEVVFCLLDSRQLLSFERVLDALDGRSVAKSA